MFKCKASSDKEDASTTEGKPVCDSGLETEVAGSSTNSSVKQERYDVVNIDDDDCEGQRFDIGRYAKRAKLADDKYDVFKKCLLKI